jgi:hypothetical protein
VALKEPFGKDTLTQFFYSNITFWYTLPYLYNLGWPSKKDRNNLKHACSSAKQHAILWKQYCNTGFHDAQAFWKDWQLSNQLGFVLKDMITACFLHYFCNTPTIMRYLGGPYVLAHHDPEKILATLKPMIDPAVFTELARAYCHGCPRMINATATDANFQQAVAYGNHKYPSSKSLSRLKKA